MGFTVSSEPHPRRAREAAAGITIQVPVTGVKVAASAPAQGPTARPVIDLSPRLVLRTSATRRSSPTPGYGHIPGHRQAPVRQGFSPTRSLGRAHRVWARHHRSSDLIEPGVSAHSPTDLARALGIAAGGVDASLGGAVPRGGVPSPAFPAGIRACVAWTATRHCLGEPRVASTGAVTTQGPCPTIVKGRWAANSASCRGALRSSGRAVGVQLHHVARPHVDLLDEAAIKRATRGEHPASQLA